MNQITPFALLNTNTSFKSIALAAMLYFLSSANPLHAQAAGSQASTLLEVQALRQEVAQLRDMVERQQYELRKMQRSQQASKAPVANTQGESSFTSSKPLGSTLPVKADVSGVVPKGSAVSGTQSSTLFSQAGLDNSVGVINPSVVPTQRVLTTEKIQNSTAVPSSSELTQTGVDVISQAGEATKQLSGRSYPPVVEIAVGKPLVKPQAEPNPVLPSSRSIASTGETAVANSVVNQVNAAGTQVGQSIEQTVASVAQPTVINGGGISVSDIKPIETINAGSIVSIPSAPTTTQTSSGITSVLDNGVNSNKALNIVSENDYYQQAFGLLKESKHAEAVAVFQQQIKAYPQGEKADDAYYWIAESMYVNRKLDISKENFKAIVQGYPKSERLPDAMLKLAYIEQEQGNIIEARILLQEIIQFYPASDAALLAKNRLSELN